VGVRGDETGGHELDAPPWSRFEGTLISTAGAVRRAYQHVLAEAGLDLAEASILAHLADGGAMSQVELARRLHTGRARIGVYIDALVRKQAVQRDPDPTDRRVWMVSLTESGWQLWSHSVEIDRRLRLQLRAGTTREDRQRLDALLVLIERNASGLFASDPSAAGGGGV
jgi:MarR family transcriptional regulator, transcriptional regulator for hemolysin